MGNVDMEVTSEAISLDKSCFSASAGTGPKDGSELSSDSFKAKHLHNMKYV